MNTDGTRERARVERRDLDLERGEPLSKSGARFRPRSLRRAAKPLDEWESRPRILITNDDGIESRGILALKEALDPIGFSAGTTSITVLQSDEHGSRIVERLNDTSHLAGTEGSVNLGELATKMGV